MADIQNKKHKNWYRGAIATLITKKAVAPFSEDVISDFVEQLIVDINTINNRESGFVCRSCKIQNLLPCPTRGFCSVSKGDCKFHSTPDLIPAFCPNGLCDKIRDKIILNHRFSSPSWKNTKPEEWCTNVWQVAKCFFPPDGYIDVCHPEDTDFNGIISLIINCTLFQNHVSDNLSNKGNVFDQAREVGKSIRHSPSLHVSNTELSGYYDVLVALLSDATLQQSNLATKQALRKLRKLKASPLVTSIEEEIADESLKSCSSDESLSDCLKQTISKSDIFWDSSDCSSIVDDGVETDTDSGETYSSSISSEDSHDEKSTADQPGEWVIKGSASRINSWPLQCLGNQNLHHLFDFPGESKIVTPTTSPFRLYGQEATEDGSMATGTIMLHLDENMNIFSIDRTPTTAHEVQTSRAIHEVPISIDVKKVQTPRAVNEMQTSRAVDEMQPSSTVYDLPISIDVNKVQTPSAVYATQISSTVHEMKTSSALHEVQTSSAVYQVPISSAVEEVQTTPSAALGVQTSSAVYEVPILSAVKEVQTTPSAALGMQTSSAVYEVPISSAVNEVQTTPSAALWVQTSSNVHELQTTSRAIHEVLISKATDELQTSGSRSSESQPMSTGQKSSLKRKRYSSDDVCSLEEQRLNAEIQNVEAQRRYWEEKNLRESELQKLNIELLMKKLKK